MLFSRKWEIKRLQSAVSDIAQAIGAYYSPRSGWVDHPGESSIDVRLRRLEKKVERLMKFFDLEEVFLPSEMEIRKVQKGRKA